MIYKIGAFLKNVYTWIALLTMVLGFGVAVMYLVSLVVGGSAGETLAVFAGELMNFGIILAAFAILAGIIHCYIIKDHSLTLSSEKKGRADERGDTTSSEPLNKAL